MKIFAKLVAVAFCASVFAALIATPALAQATSGSGDKMHAMAHGKMMAKGHRKHHRGRGRGRKKVHPAGMMGHKMGHKKPMMGGKKGM